MTLYVDVITSVTDLFVDFIEVKLKSGEIVSLNWDETEFTRTETGFTAQYNRVCFDEEYADGKLDQLRDMKVDEVGLYSETESVGSIVIMRMEFEEGDRVLIFDGPVFSKEGADLSG